MTERLGIIACDGALPVRIASAHPEAFVVSLAGVPNQLGKRAQEHRIEKIGGLFRALKAENVTRLVFAGALSRPKLDPASFDAEMMALAPRFASALQNGDDGLLREVVAMFEEQGFQVVGAHELLPDLTAEAGLAVGVQPSEGDLADARRGLEILAALSPIDVSQGCVVSGGQCLGIETVQGTDAMLKFVATTPAQLRCGQKGVYVKAAKAGQDVRIDMPTIGPRSIASVAKAGLAGLVIEAGRVMIVKRAEVLEAVEDTGLFLRAVEV